MKSRFLLESIIGPRMLDTALQLTASGAIYSKGKAPPRILIDDHLPYPQAILRVFGDIQHRRREHGRGRFKHPCLKPPADLQVGVVKKLRDNRGNLLKVSSQALFGPKKQIEKRIRELGIGGKINTSHMERLNGTIRGQEARLIRRTRAGSHLEQMLQYSIWLWRDLYNWTRVHYSLLDETPAMALGLTDEVWSVLNYILYPVYVSDLQRQDWAELEQRKKSLAGHATGHLIAPGPLATARDGLRLLIETDAGGDPDDEQSLVRFLLYANEWDVEGIIASRPMTRRPENKNPQAPGLGIVRRLLDAYGQCWPNLIQHDVRHPSKEFLWQRTVAGYNDTNDAVDLIIAAVDKDDPRPLWYSDWGTDNGAAVNNLKRALDLVQRRRGPAGYARFKSKLRLSSAGKFGDHTAAIAPPFTIWVNTFQPPLEGKRWYHPFFLLTSKAGGFDLVRDVLSGHGPLGALYPTNTTHWAKEGDTMTFLYLVPTGMNDPNEPLWGSWAGRYGHNESFSGTPYYWANQSDTWNGTTSRDNTLARWAADLQNDFRARLDWCVKSPHQANHAPHAVVNGAGGKGIVYATARPGQTLSLEAGLSWDPDGDALLWEWFVYREAGTYEGEVTLANPSSSLALLQVPNDAADKAIQVVLTVSDGGTPPLAAYRRLVVRICSE